MHAQIVLFDGFGLLDVVAPYDVLYAGGIASGEVTVEFVSAEGPREVVSGAGGITLRATGTLDPDRPGVIIVPGAAGRLGEPAADADERQRNEFINVLLARALTTELPALLRKATDSPQVTVATVCAGSLIPAMAGMLEGRVATTNRMALGGLQAAGVRAVGARVVDDGDLISGGGVTSGLDVALYLLEREVGPRVAHAVEELFEYERRGTTWRDRGVAASW
ncbi:DJ-1/PfpI family protein [Nocardia mexicana]|uniref:DJ-1/PfpI family protein n=1 Tax=Nocardia mexicana TaxID=279262 RepID=A0A370GK63_9NOCA|nr:DJ-1/PfpI family protein [Nocardia mexicana]RDI42784.1 DJ-1/PfpI family protein [Nocardia mexicana]